MGFEGVALGELGVADVALVGLLPGVDPQVTFQLERVWAGVGAVGTLERPLARVPPIVIFQLAVRLKTFLAHIAHKPDQSHNNKIKNKFINDPSLENIFSHKMLYHYVFSRTKNETY